MSVRAAAAEIIAADFYAAPTDSLLQLPAARQRSDSMLTCCFPRWQRPYAEHGIFNFITFVKINAKRQCYNCLNVLNMVLKRFGGKFFANDVNIILRNKFIGTRWRFVYSCRQRTVSIEHCVKYAALQISAAGFRQLLPGLTGSECIQKPLNSCTHRCCNYVQEFETVMIMTVNTWIHH